MKARAPLVAINTPRLGSISTGFRTASETRLCWVRASRKIEVEQILETTQSWDGINYKSYPTGQPQLTVLRIKVPPNTALHWHHHPVINVGYVLSGHLTIEKRDVSERTIVHAGQTFAETVANIVRALISVGGA
jgi:quercetin dioxygenase-like cupin family protein